MLGIGSLGLNEFAVLPLRWAASLLIVVSSMKSAVDILMDVRRENMLAGTCGNRTHPAP